LTPSTYRYCGTADAVLPIEQVVPPSAAVVAARGLPRIERMRAGMAACVPLPPLDVYRHAGRVFLVHGLHRYTVSREIGHSHVPARFCTEDDFPIRPFTLSDYE
jgi:hypothetical protein